MDDPLQAADVKTSQPQKLREKPLMVESWTSRVQYGTLSISTMLLSTVYGVLLAGL